MIEVRGLTKRYGSMVAVDRLSFDVPPGAVTGFLGLNGSGKSTTMRMILGLDSPDAGERPGPGGNPSHGHAVTETEPSASSCSPDAARTIRVARIRERGVADATAYRPVGQ